MIPFCVPTFVGKEQEYLEQVVRVNRRLSGDGPFTKKCSTWFEQRFGANRALLTTSCTHALEMAALLLDIQPGDEVISPSYTFVSTVNAFVLRGATIVFVDLRPDTMNIDERLIEAAITDRTRVIVPVHYAGVSCELDKIMEIANRYGLRVVEDAAQGVMSKYKERALGTIGDLGCYSFHETKNYCMGEGGALLVNNTGLVERAEIIREKGTDRTKFLRGQVDKYTWVDIGSSYLPSELNAAYLYAQLEYAEEITVERLRAWNAYYHGLQTLRDKGLIELPYIPDSCQHNAHMFYVKCKDLQERTELINHLKANGICSAFHYIPLHTSGPGMVYGRFSGADRYTTRESERLLRLPLYHGITESEIGYVVEKIGAFYGLGSKR